MTDVVRGGRGGGDLEKDDDGWTTDTVRMFILTLMEENDRRYEQRFIAQEQATSMMMQAAKEAVTKAEAANDKRFDGVNEFRSALSDQIATYVTRAEFDGRVKALDDAVTFLSAAQMNFMRADVYESQHKELVVRTELLETWRTTVNARISVFIGIAVLTGGTVGALIGHLIK